MRTFTYAALASMAAFTLACSNGQGDNSSGSRGRNEGIGGNNTQAMDAQGNGQARASLTGCLLAGGDAGSYVLQLASAGDTSTQGTSSATPSAGGAWAAGQTYRVVAQQGNDDLQNNLNKRVVVSGYVESGNQTVGTSGSSTGSSSDNMARNGNSANNSNMAGASGVTSGTPDQNGMSASRRTNPEAGSTNSMGNGVSSNGSSMQTIRAESIRKVGDECQARAQ